MSTDNSLGDQPHPPRISTTSDLNRVSNVFIILTGGFGLPVTPVVEKILLLGKPN